MKPILIVIRKKTRVPTKRQLVNLYRSDWKPIGRIEYNQSRYFFSQVRTEAQFAYVLYKNYGPGIYSCLFWKKGKRSFRSFWKGELFHDGFMRLPKNKKESPMIKDIQEDLRNVEKKLSETQSEKERRELEDEKADLIEELDSERGDDSTKDSTHKSGPSPFLKTTKPPYRKHDYEGINKNQNQTSSDDVYSEEGVEEYWD